MARVDAHEKVIILSDSIWKYCEPPYQSTFVPIRGAVVRTFTRLIRRREYNLLDYELLVLHVGSNDVDNAFRRSTGRNESHWSDEVVARDIFYDFEQLVSIIKHQNNNISIILSGILPRPKTFTAAAGTTILVNKKLAKFCKERGDLHFNHTYRIYLHHSQPKLELFAKDREHLSRKGTMVATLTLKNMVSLYYQGRLSFSTKN